MPEQIPETFISATPDDRIVAQELARVMGSHGFPAIYQAVAEDGESYPDAVERALATASVYVLLVSRSARGSEQASFETGLMIGQAARRSGCLLIPVLLAGVSWDDVPIGLRAWGGIDGRQLSVQEIAVQLSIILKGFVQAGRFDATTAAETTQPPTDRQTSTQNDPGNASTAPVRVIKLKSCRDLGEQLDEEIRWIQATQPFSTKFQLLIDFSNIEFVSSSHWGRIINLDRLVATAGGTLALAGLREGLVAFLRVTHIDRLIKVVSEASEAQRLRNGLSVCELWPNASARRIVWVNEAVGLPQAGRELDDTMRRLGVCRGEKSTMGTGSKITRWGTR